MLLRLDHLLHHKIQSTQKYLLKPVNYSKLIGQLMLLYMLICYLMHVCGPSYHCNVPH